MLIQYVRKNNKPVGCLVATKREDGKVAISYSACKKGDKFTKKLAREIAFGRTKKNCISLQVMQSPVLSLIPFALRNSLEGFINRTERYFKIGRDEMVF